MKINKKLVVVIGMFFLLLIFYLKPSYAAYACCSCKYIGGGGTASCVKDPCCWANSCFCDNGLGTDNACNIGCDVTCYWGPGGSCLGYCENDGTDKCPSSGWKDGDYATILHEWWCGLWICSHTCTFTQDASEQKVVRCGSDHTETAVCGDTSGLYYKDSYNCDDWCTKAGDKQCESGCGAASVCDEKSPNTNIAQCGCGATYFADKCDSNCGCVDGDSICRSSAYASDCTADSSCNGVAANSDLLDSCGATTLEVNRHCSSTCTYTSTKYICSASEECNIRSCGGKNYICYRSNAGSWVWGTSAESKETACNDGYDNDCDGKKDCYDSDCPVNILSLIHI